MIPLRRYVGASLFICFNMGLFAYWAAFPLVNTVYTHGYPQFVTPVFQSARYWVGWWLVWCLTLNALLPMTLAFAMTLPDIEEITRFHAWLSMAAKYYNWALVLVFSVAWLVLANSGYSGIASDLNDYRWCCAYFPSTWCPNGTPCDPTVMAVALSRNGDAVANWGFAFVYAVLASFNSMMNRNLREYGVLK